MDFMATKGLEYLLIFAYLILLVPFWRLLMGAEPAGPSRLRMAIQAGTRGWFSVPDGFHFHPGHSWARAESDDLVTIGMDDVAHRLIGPPKGLELPPTGATLAAGEAGWSVRVDGRTLPVLSPVNGEVAATNEAAIRDPGSLGGDPVRRRMADEGPGAVGEGGTQQSDARSGCALVDRGDLGGPEHSSQRSARRRPPGRRNTAAGSRPAVGRRSMAGSGRRGPAHRGCAMNARTRPSVDW